MVESEVQEQIIETSHLRAVITRKPGCNVHIEAQATPIAAAAAYEKAFKSIKKEVAIAGFRKGKAPDEIVLKNYGSHIEREWKSLVLRTTLQEALDTAKLRPFSEHSVRRADIKKCSQAEGADCVFDLEVEPEIPEIDTALFSVTKVDPAPVTDEDVAHELENIRLSRATWEDVTDRPCAVGDFVEIDVDVIENPAHNLFSNRLFRVEKEHMPEWLFAIVPGMNPSDSKDTVAAATSCGSSDPHHTHSDSCSSGKEKQVRVILKTIKKAILPEENDELAKECNHESMDQFKKSLREIIQKHRVESIQENERMEIYGQLLEQYPIDVPQSIIDAESRSRFQYIRRHSNVKKGELPMEKEKEDLLKGQIAYEAKGFLTCMYLLQRLAQKIDMTVLQDELMHEYTVETVYVPYNQRLIYPGMEPEEIRSRLYTKVMMRKGIDYILTNAGKA